MEINELKNSKKGARTARSRLGSLLMKHLVLVVVVAVVVLVGVRALGASICSKMAMQPVPLKLNFVNRIPGFAGPNGPNGNGPDGVLVTPSRKLWAGDGNATVQVADVDPKSPDYLKIIQSVNVAIPACGSHCNAPTS